uniref:Uncharacterized protein n=1 Tax=Candidatus Kentrum sp. FW TaxID=2126338 RepID=A0A450T2A5_9GAMM|nr:MAG: hypothetical protein BECKFW1821B_GA0114236_105814 [Candidatus Kentron sp. FW]
MRNPGIKSILQDIFLNRKSHAALQHSKHFMHKLRQVLLSFSFPVASNNSANRIAHVAFPIIPQPTHNGAHNHIPFLAMFFNR